MKAAVSMQAPMHKLVILCGIPFAGKSTLAKALIARLNGSLRIDLDEIKFRLFGSGVSDDSLTQADWDDIYKKMYREIASGLKDHTVIHDTGNFTRGERSLVQSIARRSYGGFVTVFVDTPVSVARERLEANRIAHTRFDITDDQFQSAVAEMEPPDTSENLFRFTLGSSIEDLVRYITR